MTTQSLKLDLISRLTKVNDKKMLESLASVMDSFSSGDWYNDLSPEQKKSIQRGMEDHRKGKFISSSEFKKRYAKKA